MRYISAYAGHCSRLELSEIILSLVSFIKVLCILFR